MESLIEEYERIRNKDFTLDFVYPDEAKRKALHIINREMTSSERRRVVKKITDLNEILESIETGDLRVEDLPASIRRRLRKLL